MLETPEADPYRYLEDASNPATVRWTAGENARTRAALDALPDRARLLVRFENLTRIDSVGVPVACGERTFYTARRGEADQTVLYVRDAQGERSLLDPAVLDPSGLTALDWWYPSRLGRYVAFGLSLGGDERSTLYVLDVATGERRSEAIPDTRHCSLAWQPDEEGFYYTRYPPGAQYDVRLYGHAMGRPWPADSLIFGEGRKPEEWIVAALCADGAFLAVTVYDGWARSDVYVARVAAGEAADFVPVVAGEDAVYEALPGNDALYLRTNFGAPRFRVYKVEYGSLQQPRWREIVPEEQGALAGFALARDALLLHYLVDARSSLKVLRGDGRIETVLGFAERTVLALSAEESLPEAYVLHASFLEPSAVTRLTFSSDGVESSPWASVALPFDPGAYRVEQVWYASADGTRIPLTLVSRADVRHDGTAPAVLYGYGGFNVSLLPAFTPSVLPWIEAGGIYAVANLRGGGEFGEDWHQAGMRANKQNVFDDFIAAATYLGTSGAADPARIAILGGSNGGLLVAAVSVQRPELAAAVVCLVPLTDMLRFHKFLVARLWISEYGDPDDPADAEFLRAYSPYHNVKDGAVYPPMLIATAASDSRVDPMHAKKFGARLRAASGAAAPIYVNVEADAGHGAGKPRYKRVAELADEWAFIGSQLGVRFA